MNNRPARVIGVVFIVIGAIGAAFAIGEGALRGAAAFGPTSRSWSVNADGANSLLVAGFGAEMEIVFADVAEARLDATTSEAPLGNWSLNRNGSVIEVSREHGGFGWGDWGIGDPGDRDDHDDSKRGGWDDWRDWGYRAGRETVVLTLPLALERPGLSGDITLSAGKLQIDGEWDALDVAVNAATLDFEGRAESLAVSARAGMADVEASVAKNATFEVHGGRVQGALQGEQPESIAVTANAAAVELGVPTGEYDVDRGTVTGEVSVTVDESTEATSTITVSANAASVRLEAR